MMSYKRISLANKCRLSDAVQFDIGHWPSFWLSLPVIRITFQ